MKAKSIISKLGSNLKINVSAIFLALVFVLGLNNQSKACTPMAIPTLSLQTIAGGSLQLTWVSNTAWACQYKIELELKCLGTNFTGVAPFFDSPSISKPSPAPLVYPQVQAIDLATLCPGTAYQFRARENSLGGFSPSGWTPTFTFVTPGAFVLPIIQPIPNPTICPTNTTQLTAQLQNACGPGPITYSWAPALGLSCVTCSNPIANPTVQTSYTVTVQGGPLSCWTATNAVTVYTSSGSAQVIASATQISCTNSVAVVSLTTAGSASVPTSVSWSPAPISLSGNSLIATGLPPGIATVAVVDIVGCIKIVTIQILPAPPPLTFSVLNLTGTYTITCTNPTINLQAVSNYTYGTINYNWSSPSFTANTTTVSISAPIPSLVLTGVDPATGCVFQYTMAIGINTAVPVNTVNPLSQASTCNSGSPVTFSGTVSNPTINILHEWYSPLNPLPGGVPIATSANTLSILSGSLPPGIYTLVTTNQVNGCKSQKTVTVTSLSAWPTFSVASPTNFSVGCSPLNQTTLSIVNPVSTQTPPATCSYTFLPPSFGGVVTPSIILGGNTSTVTTIPGTWTIIVQDNSNWCRTIISVPVIQNTVGPHVISVTQLPTQTLTCTNPTLLATGSSTTANTVVTWNIPQNPPQLSTHTVVIGPVTGPNTSTTSLTYANYTVVATNTLNACQTTSVVQIYQNFKPPVSSPTISIGTPTAIYCNVANAPAVLTTGNSTTTSGGLNAFVANPCWQGPSPQASICGVSSYSCYVPGIYSLSVMDSYNGCYNTGTIQVLDRTQPPMLTNSVSVAALDCGINQATLQFVLTGTNTGGIRYLVVDYPHGAAFTPTNAPVYNVNPLLSGTSSQSVNVSEVGYYTFIVSNTLTGCQSQGTVNVVPGTLTASFDPDVTTGYPPLSVTFSNNSVAGASNASITSIWSFGNGSVKTTTTVSQTNATYEAPGTYTVMMISTKGGCIDTAYKIIKVDMPSKMEVPNIFTPNGDGSNDVFFLKTANLGEIIATIFDRWGNKVYETNSSTGNIAWDGKNLQGKECSAGVYFYVIKASGRDSKEYEQKGNVSLYR